MADLNIKEFIKEINDLLEKGEPCNVSVDEHTGQTGYKPQAVVDAMNDVFPIGAWGFDDLSNEIVKEPADKSGLAVGQVRVWLEGVKFQPTAYGQSRVTRGDIGDAKKGAQTDAIKKALSYFSIGKRAYHGLLVAPPKGNNQQRPTQQPPARPTNVPPPKPATPTKTQQPAENKKPATITNLPTPRMLREEAIKLEIKSKSGAVLTWTDVLKYACKSVLKTQADLQKLADAGDELHPRYCEMVNEWLENIKFGRKAQAETEVKAS